MRVALVHDFLAQDGGAEKVLRVFQHLYPEAPTYTIVHDRQQAGAYAQADIRTSFVQRMLGGVRNYRWYLPLMPLAVERFNLSAYDVVLSSASAFAKGVLTRADAVHICYCHSPTRYLWSDTYDYLAALPYNRAFKRVIEWQLSRMRQWDRLAADRVDYFLANSRTVQQRIRKYYRRESTVIYPPVAVDQFSIAPKIGKYFLTGGRLVAYKRFDLAIAACTRLGLPLKVFGTGPETPQLRAMAKGTVEFVGRVNGAQLAQLYAEAQAFINPQEEDFGITAVESMAAGRPVIAYGRGGALETVQPGLSGVLFDEQAWEPLADAIIRFKSAAYDPQAIRAWAQQFSAERFAREIQAFVASHSTPAPTAVQ